MHLFLQQVALGPLTNKVKDAKSFFFYLVLFIFTTTIYCCDNKLEKSLLGQSLNFFYEPWRFKTFLMFCFRHSIIFLCFELIEYRVTHKG